MLFRSGRFNFSLQNWQRKIQPALPARAVVTSWVRTSRGHHRSGPSGKSGGDLGWFSPKSMVKPFSEAVATLKKGGYTHEPVKTQFGWHIIQLEDVRQSTPPAFDQVKPRLEMLARNQRVQDYINSLRSKATIQITETEVKPAAAPAPAPANTADQSTTKPADTSASTDKQESSKTAADAKTPGK